MSPRMKGMHYINYFFILIFLAFAGCKKEDEPNTLTVSSNPVSFSSAGGNINITIRTNADSWSISNPGLDWLNISSTNGSGSSSVVTLSVNTRTLTTRTGTLVIRAGNATPVELTVKQGSSDFLYVLTADLTTIDFAKEGGPKSLKITTDATAWTINADTDWLQLSETTGSNGVKTITVTALENKVNGERTGFINVSASKASPLKIPVTQKGRIYPDYNTSPLPADATGMSSTAVELAAKVHLGLNIGNTLEAIGSETAWGNPKVSKALIDLVKQNGFNAIRIPCSWNQYMENSTTAKLNTAWLNRVKEVVQYCVDNDMYVLLNIHWDGGWLENNCTPEKQEQNNAKQQAFWEQIATHLRDFDEHLLFAGANEPNVENATQMTVLNSYHQTFLNAVRSTGGKNSYRVLVVQGPSTDIEKTKNLMTTLPTDPMANRLMVEVHYYTPWNFCGLTEDASWGKMFYYWGKDNRSTTDPERNSTSGEEAVASHFALMKAKFVDKGIPVVLGEYTVMLRSSLTGDALKLHRASRLSYFKYVTQQAKANGMLPFFWDIGVTANNGSGLFDRSNNTVFDQQAIDALVEGAK